MVNEFWSYYKNMMLLKKFKIMVFLNNCYIFEYVYNIELCKIK